MAPPLTTDRLVLREFRVGDLESVQRYATDSRVTEHLCWGPNDRTGTEAFLLQAGLAADARPRLRYDLAVERLENGELIGGCGLRQCPPGTTWEIGYTLRRNCWGRGYGAEVVEALVQFGIEELGASRLVAEVFLENPASRRILARLGFRNLRRVDRYIPARGRNRRSMLYELVPRQTR